MASIDIEGTTFEYADRGRGSGATGTPLVLLHAFPLDSRIFSHQLDHLSTSHRVIAPDLRGFGQTRSERTFSIQSLADDVHAMLSQLDSLPCILGGVSMGGYISFAFARKYPTDLRGLILMDTRAEGDTPEGKHNRDKLAALARDGGAKAVADQMFPKMVSPATVKDQPQTAASARTMMESCPPRTIELASYAMRDRPDFTEELPSIPVPTLIIVGADDAITGLASARKMHDCIPRSVLKVIPSAGHLAVLEQPDAVNSAIAEFVAKVESGEPFPYHSEKPLPRD